MIKERKPHPPSQKEKSFSLGTFGTHATGFKCFDSDSIFHSLRLKKPFSFLQQTRFLLFSEIRS